VIADQRGRQRRKAMKKRQRSKRPVDGAARLGSPDGLDHPVV
jgi:hypothetical protein